MIVSQLFKVAGMVSASFLFATCTNHELAPSAEPTVSKIDQLRSSLKGTLMTINQLRSLRVAAAPDSIYLTDDGKEGLFTLASTDKTTPDNVGTVLVTSDGLRYKRSYSGAASAAWFNLSSADDDIGPELQNAVNSSNDVFIPDGEYRQRTKVILRSGVNIHANPGKVTLKLTGDGYISFQNFLSEQDLNNVTIDGINWQMASTARVEGSYGPITIDGPNVRNLTVK